MVRPFGDDSPNTNYDSRARSQWGRDQIYPEYPLTFIIFHNLPIITQ